MTDTTEALRAQFEKYVNPAGDMKMHRVSGGGYAGHGLNKSWHDFQAGHAAGVAAERKRCAMMHEAIEAAVKAVDMGFAPNENLEENSPIMQAFRYAIRAGDGEASND